MSSLARLPLFGKEDRTELMGHNREADDLLVLRPSYFRTDCGVSAEPQRRLERVSVNLEGLVSSQCWMQ